jgi:hypothetical protein
VDGKCKIHGNVKYLFVKSAGAKLCLDCVKDNFYKKELKDEMAQAYPQYFTDEMEISRKFSFQDKSEAEEAIIKGLMFLKGYTSLKALHDTLTPMADKQIHSIQIPLPKIHYRRVYPGVPVEFVLEDSTCIGVEMFKPISERRES